MRGVIKILGIFLLTFCLHATCFAQQSIDEIVEQIMEVKHAPGFAFIVAQNGKIVEEGYYGLSNLELKVPITENSVFCDSFNE